MREVETERLRLAAGGGGSKGSVKSRRERVCRVEFAVETD